MCKNEESEFQSDVGPQRDGGVRGGGLSMGMGGNIAMPPRKVHGCQSKACDENNSRIFEALFEDTTIRNTVLSY